MKDPRFDCLEEESQDGILLCLYPIEDNKDECNDPGVEADSDDDEEKNMRLEPPTIYHPCVGDKNCGRRHCGVCRMNRRRRRPPSPPSDDDQHYYYVDIPILVPGLRMPTTGVSVCGLSVAGREETVWR